MSMASTVSLAFRRDRSTLFLPGAGDENSPFPRFHPAPSRNEIAVVQPCLVGALALPDFGLDLTCKQIKPIDSDILSTVAFLPRSILTSTKNGYIKLWIRPLALRPRMKHRTPAPDVDVL
jgi:hypothetical protein